MGLVEDFAELFQGRMDAFGTEEGGCFRPGPPFEGNPHYWRETIERHLKGVVPIGVYPMAYMMDPAIEAGPVWKVRWGCIDFDEGEEESWPHAVNVRAVLERFGITAWIERSRSKGFHVWVFIDSWVAARTVRRALLAACQLVGAPTKEINPKQEELSEGQLGNYVRLPYPGAMGPDRGWPQQRRVMINGGHPIELASFVERALASRTNESQLEQVAALLKQKPKSLPKRTITLAEAQFATEPMKRLSGLAYTILTEGPKEGADRSTTLWKLATRIHDDGAHTFEEALELMIQADLAWGKFMERGDSGEAELRRMLEKIWDD